MEHEQKQVLLIEDDGADYQLIKRCLSRTTTTYNLDWSASLGAGLSMLANKRYDVVLSDLSLPDSLGLETIRRIRLRAPSIAIVVLTTLDDVNIEEKSLTAGAQDYLLKSDATPHTLDRAIHHAIQRQQSLVEVQRLFSEVNAARELLAEQKDLLEHKNRRLRKLYKTAHRFVDNVSHEFRTPLTVIKDYISLVREGMVGPVNGEQRRMLDIAGVRADDLNTMVDDMLDVSKLQSGLLGAWRRNCNLSDIVLAVQPALLKKAEIKDISFETSVPVELPAVYCDAEKVGRVIINLVTNAMKFCGSPGQVRLWAQDRPDRHEVVIGVTDNGPGIDEEGLTEIFKRFKQLKTDLKSSTKGFGLGLNIAKELVELNFGAMHVESRLDQGSTFSFTVPHAEPVEIARRYLDGLTRFRQRTATVSFARVVTESASASDTDDFDAFLNYLLRRNDLLFRKDQQSWLFLLSAPRCELERFVVRLTEEYEKANRNRPLGPLPRFDIDVHGPWEPCSQCTEIMEHFRSEMCEGLTV